jgi:hypothetical protein
MIVTFTLKLALQLKNMTGEASGTQVSLKMPQNAQSGIAFQSPFTSVKPLLPFPTPINESGSHHPEQGKPSSKGQRSHVLNHLWNLDRPKMMVTLRISDMSVYGGLSW